MAHSSTRQRPRGQISPRGTGVTQAVRSPSGQSSFKVLHQGEGCGAQAMESGRCRTDARGSAERGRASPPCRRADMRLKNNHPRVRVGLGLFLCSAAVISTAPTAFVGGRGLQPEKERINLTGELIFPAAPSLASAYNAKLLHPL